MKYQFNGILLLSENKTIPFNLVDGNLSFAVCYEKDIDITKENASLSGLTEDGKEIHLLIDRFWKLALSHTIQDGKEVFILPHIEGVVSACAIVEPSTFDKINSIGFYSLEIEKITGRSITGNLNDNNSSFLNIKQSLARYSQDDHHYQLSIGFVENSPVYQNQLLELKAEKEFDLEMMKASFWTIKEMLNFLYQKRTVPLEDVILRVNEKNVGHLYIENFGHSTYIFNMVKCLSVYQWGDKLNTLLQLLGEHKIYLRHLPVFAEDQKVITHGRFLMALIGLENILDELNIHSAQPKSQRERLKDRIVTAINDNCKEIENFYSLESLGANIENISADLAKMRNKLAHGNLEFELTIHSCYQMDFLMLFILYLQLIYIGFDKAEASRIVLYFRFEH